MQQHLKSPPHPHPAFLTVLIQILQFDLNVKSLNLRILLKYQKNEHIFSTFGSFFFYSNVKIWKTNKKFESIHMICL